MKGAVQCCSEVVCHGLARPDFSRLTLGVSSVGGHPSRFFEVPTYCDNTNTDNFFHTTTATTNTSTTTVTYAAAAAATATATVAAAAAATTTTTTTTTTRGRTFQNIEGDGCGGKNSACY